MAGNDFNHDIFSVKCPNGGNYSITETANSDLPFHLKNDLKEKKHLISGYLRELTEDNLKPDLINSKNIYDMLKSPKIPLKLNDKINKMLLYLKKHTSYFGQQITINLNQPAIAYALNNQELLAFRDFVCMGSCL